MGERDRRSFLKASGAAVLGGATTTGAAAQQGDGVTVQFQEGYNLVGVTEPVTLADLRGAGIEVESSDNYEGPFLTVDDDGEYVGETTMEVGSGYWVQVRQGGTFTMREAWQQAPVSFADGLNLVSSPKPLGEKAVREQVDVDPKPWGKEDPFVWYDPDEQSFVGEATMQPGKGYFVESRERGTYTPRGGAVAPLKFGIEPKAASTHDAFFELSVSIESLEAVENGNPNNVSHFELRTPREGVQVRDLVPVEKESGSGFWRTLGGEIVLFVIEEGSGAILNTGSIPVGSIFEVADAFVDMQNEHEPRDEKIKRVKFDPDSYGLLKGKTMDFLVWLESEQPVDRWGQASSLDGQPAAEFHYTYQKSVAGPTESSESTQEVTVVPQIRTDQY